MSGLSSDLLLRLLLALTLIVVTARLLAAVLQRVGQPPVIGEVVGGLLLGPSLLGRIAPDAAAFLFPPLLAPVLSGLGQLGIILYLFLVGVELDLRLLRERRRAVLIVAPSGMALAFGLGLLLAAGLAGQGWATAAPLTSFALFLGVAMSVTAFPVLARILTDQGVSQSPLGQLALACAAGADVAAWCLLALAVSTAQGEPARAGLTLGLTVVGAGLALRFGRPVLARLVERYDRVGDPSGQIFAGLILMVLLAALTSEWIGIHALFGAFLLGALVPARSQLAESLAQRLEDIVRVLFLPVYFAFTGLRTQVGLLESPADWLLCGLIILLATLGKWGGSASAARGSGLPWREALALGILLNTRGLVELIVLNVGLDLGIISPKLYTMLVLMAIFTTLLTTPVFRAITRGHR